MPKIYDFGGFGLGGYSTDDDVTFDALTLYYIGLLIIQYQNKPKARAHVGFMVQEVVANQIIAQVRDAFDVKTAVGQQLDLLAEYRGALREVFGLSLTRSYFAMPFYTDGSPGAGIGFALYGDSPITGYFLLYDDFNRPIYSMTDDELRRLIQLRAQVQSQFLSVAEIDAILVKFFGSNLLLNDNGDMSITYVHNPGDTDTLYTIVAGTNSLPKPAGVAIILA